MRRREFIAGLTVAAALPLAARAQQPRLPVVGLISGVSLEGPYAGPVAAIRQGLAEIGFVEGQNVTIDYRSAGGRYERLGALAADLVRNQAAVIVAIGASSPEPVATAAASQVPIVFAMGSDAVEVGLVKSSGGSGANVASTGAATADLGSRRLELLLEVRPGASLVGYLGNSRASAAFDTNVGDLTAIAGAKGKDLAVFDAATEEQVETAFTHMALQRVRLLVVSPDPFLTTRQEQIIALAAQSALPTIYATRGAAVLGGLMSYGVLTNLTNDAYRLAGNYAGQVLKGATPAESPGMLPARFELVVNKATAKALRIAVPPRLLVRADETIE